jgi:membrane protein DedA with SNARE-associated domain
VADSKTVCPTVRVLEWRPVQTLLEFLQRYGYWVLFGNVLIEQIGLPLPAVPVLLAMGALSGLGHFSVWIALLLAVSAALLSDLVWYRLGIERGGRILGLVCKVSLEPDSCVSSTKNTFSRWGAYAFLFAKFVPGLSAVAAPMAGLTRMPLSKFLTADLIGACLWSGAYLGAGYVLHNQLEKAAELASRMGGALLTLVACLLAGYIGAKYYQRRRFIRDLRVARVTPENLKTMLEAGEPIAIVDLRNALEFEFGGSKIPGAIWMDAQELDARHEEIPREREVVLYCS